MEAQLLVILVIVGITNAIGEAMLTPVLQTLKGPVQGEILETFQKKMKYSSFRGIPFAEPPTGYRRFRPPVDKEPWAEVLKATQDGSNCVQKDSYYQRYTGSENCLYLNVYTPHTMFTKESLRDLKPVMVWIYGGRFLNGYANSSIYGPDFILEQSVVLVTFNYRVGPLGFLNLEHENATGNAGLKDQNAVLKWVNKNIINFGGNPESVTIFGQSAGAVSVDYHVLSDMSQGLFHRSISMSGSPLVSWGFQKPISALRNAFTLGKILGIETEDKDTLLELLYEASAEDIMRIAQNMTKISAAFRPSVESTEVNQNEEKFLIECPTTKYEEGRYNKGPHIMGTMKHESVSFSKNIANLIEEIDDVRSTSRSTFGRSILTPITRKFSKWTVSLASTSLDMATKILFLSGIDKKQRLMRIHNEKPIYYYQISVAPKFSLHKSITQINLDGAAHGDDLLYLFHTRLFNIPIDKKNLFTITRNRVLKLWTNFAKYGNPNPVDEEESIWGFSWPDSGEDGKYLDIGEYLTVVNQRPGGKSVKLLQSMKIGIATC